jgi:hypothetical protein
MDMGSSNHKNPPWRTSINFLTQLFTTFPLPKWGITTNFRIHVFSRLVAHFFGCSIGSPNGLMHRLSMYTCCANSRNFLLSSTSCSMYLSLSTQPSRVCVACTPSGMCGNTIETSGCLHGDRAMGCFSFLLTDAVEVPAYGSLSSPLDSGCLVMSSTCPSSYSTEPTTVFGLAPSDSVCSLSPPFVLWVASGLTGCCGLLVATGLWPCALSCKSISISVIVGACYSSSTSVTLTGSTCDEGIASTLTIPSLCVVSYSTSVVSRGDRRLLCVFCVAWLGVSTFGGAIVGNYFFLD